MVTAYPVAGKKKSFDLCLAFVRGCGGQIAGNRLRPGPAAFYGVNHSNESVWRAAIAEGRDRYMIDNSYFDAVRQRSFRVTKNRMQHTGTGVSDGRRFRALGVKVKPWRKAGGHIVVCAQSDSFMQTMGFEGDWTTCVVERLSSLTDREIRVRRWARNKTLAGASFQADLAGAHAVVVWSSAAAVTALIEGVPVVVESDDCAARPMAGTLDQIESLPTPDRENWLGLLADNEWTIDELTNGTAWSHLKP